MAIGTQLDPSVMQPPNTNLGVGLAGNNTAATPQSGIGSLLAQLGNNPALMQALSSAGHALLNPTTFSSIGQIGNAAKAGSDTYFQVKDREADNAFKKAVTERQLRVSERGQDTREKQVDASIDQGEQKLELDKERLGVQESQFADTLALKYREQGMAEENLEIMKQVKEAQIDLYGAQADALAEKAARGRPLSPEESKIQKVQQIFKDKLGQSEAESYLSAISLIKTGGAERDKAKMIAKYRTDNAFLQTPAFQEQFDAGIAAIEALDLGAETPDFGEDGISTEDLDAAALKVSQGKLKYADLSPVQQANLKKILGRQ